MKIGDQKVQRTLRKQKVRGLLQENKVLGTSTGNIVSNIEINRYRARQFLKQQRVPHCKVHDFLTTLLYF